METGQSSILKLGLLLCVAIALVVYKLDVLSSGSIDVAHHYALAFRIAEQWNIVSNGDSSLGSMTVYPSFSHRFVAVVSYLFGSVFLSLQFVTLLSVAVLWIGVLYVLKTLPGRLGALSSFILCLLVVLNSIFQGLNIHGSEIIRNYFFSQVVGQAILFVSMALTIRFEIRHGKLYSYLFLALLIAFNANVHLLSTLELLGILCGLVVTDFLFLHQNKNRKIIFITICVVIFAALSILLNPSFLAMQQIAGNNGALTLRYISYPVGLVFLSLLSGVMAIYQLWFWVRNSDTNQYLAVRYLALYGGSVASLCLLQMFVLKYDLGSEYAVKKYGFGLTSYLFISVSMLVARFVLRFVDRLWLVEKKYGAYTNFLVLLVIFSSMFVYSISGSKTIDVSNTVSLEKKISELKDNNLSILRPSANNIIFSLNGASSIVTYMFSIGILKTDMSLAIDDILSGGNLHDPGKYSYIIGSGKDNRVLMDECNTTLGRDISVYDANCVSEKYNELGLCKKSYNFTSFGFIVPSIVSGFSNPGEQGRWTVGEKATLYCKHIDSNYRKVKVSLTPFFYGSHDRQRLRVLVNGKFISEFNFTRERKMTFVEAPLPLLSEKNEYIITLETPDAVSPASLKYNEDPRELGFMVRNISFH